MSSMTSPTTARRGRPREFDDDAVLDVVVALFWEKGFEATSVADLVEATGLNKSSLYNAFGPKEALFERALDRYTTQRLDGLAAVLVNGTRGLDDIDAFFTLIETESKSAVGFRGCLAVNASTELGPSDEHARRNGRRYRESIRSSLHTALLRAEQGGEIASGTATCYSEVLLTWMLGIAVVSRGGADGDELDSQIEAGRALVEGWRTGS